MKLLSANCSSAIGESRPNVFLVVLHQFYMEVSSLYLSSCVSHIEFASLAEFHALCRVDNFPSDIELDGQVGPLNCALIFEEKAYNNAISGVRSSLCATHHLCCISVLFMFEATPLDFYMTFS